MPTHADFARRALIALLIAAALWLCWQIANVLLLAFGGLVLAAVIRSIAALIARRTPLSGRWASVLVMLLIVLTLVAAGYFLGDEVAGQLGELRRRLPDAIEQARAWLEQNSLGRSVLSVINSAGESLSMGRAMSAATATFSALSDLAIVLLIAMYLSFDPQMYLRGAVALAPAHARGAAQEGIDVAGKALHGWLIGQLVSMAFVAVLTGLGLWLVGVPLAITLGLVAGILEFIPFFGPFLAAVPGVLIAFSQGPTTALYAAGVYFVVQQLEGSVIMPLAQHWAVKLPPVIGVLSIVVFGLLFGIPGVLFASPLTVVIMALVRHFYVQPQDERASSA